VLTNEELRLAWHAAEGLGYPFGPLVRLLLLTGQRREEVAGLRWQELNRGAAAWTLPRERAKNCKSHLVPLSQPAIGLLDGIARSAKWPRTGFVFTTTGATPVSGYSRAKRRLDEAMIDLLNEEDQDAEEEVSAVPPWRLHDLRRTVATGLQRLGIRFEVTEAVLNHVSGVRSGVAGVYQRHDWAEEKRDALEKWAAAVERIVEVNGNANAQVDSNITPLPRRAGAQHS
jgi:integrase